jgi:DNA-binding protein|nr:helix-turn-helix transcriptional regulator [Clostridia bacterium]
MNQVKIGKFIAECRKKNNLTQMQLAEKLNITDRAISKWENGKAMPDSSIMLELCAELKISVNELLSGEVLEMNSYNEKMEQNLIDMVRQKEASDKRLLKMEIVIGVLISIVFFTLIFIASFVEMGDWLRITLIITGFIPFIIMIPFAIRIEQTAGYYECQKCHHKYIPTFSSVLWAMHINRTRYMKCPKCNQRSWQKKVITKE